MVSEFVMCGEPLMGGELVMLVTEWVLYIPYVHFSLNLRQLAVCCGKLVMCGE